jgi:hypothetical protein
MELLPDLNKFVISKHITITITTETPDLFSINYLDKITQHIKEKYVGVCFSGVYIKQFINIVRYTQFPIIDVCEGFGSVHVIFNASCLYIPEKTFMIGKVSKDQPVCVANNGVLHTGINKEVALNSLVAYEINVIQYSPMKRIILSEGSVITKKYFEDENSYKIITDNSQPSKITQFLLDGITKMQPIELPKKLPPDSKWKINNFKIEKSEADICIEINALEFTHLALQFIFDRLTAKKELLIAKLVVN